jgi:hypothetical protein
MMDQRELNMELRNFINQLISDGYLKSPICNVILGPQKIPMLTQFLEDEDRNFGLKVLTNIFSAFGYKLRLVPVKDDDENANFDEYYETFLSEYRTMLVETLDSNEKQKQSVGRKGKVASAIDKLANKIFDDLKK